MNPIRKGRENSFDAIIIGAGPAGSTAAYLLASNGLKVLVLDKHAFPRDKLCGGLLTLKTVKLLERIFQTPANFLKDQNIITYQSFDYKVGDNRGSSVKGRLDYPFHFVQRNAYDSFWLNIAQKAGARFKSHEKIVALDLASKKITTDRGHEFYGNFIFGADGALSKTRRLLIAKGFIESARLSGMATALEAFIPNRHTTGQADYPAIYFGYIPWWYTWSFPGKHLRTLGIVGLNVTAGRYLRAGWHNFLTSLDIPEKQLARPRSHPLPYGNYMSQPGYGNVLLLGDACGLADPLLGEGIYYAHKSAQLAAKAYLHFYNNPQAILKFYTRYLKRDIITELRYVRIARQVIFSSPGSWPYRILSSLLKTIPQQCEETIQGQRSFKWFRKSAMIK
jgi:geranylgeranyl reductase family protein